MIVPDQLSKAFGAEFQSLIEDFSVENGLIPDKTSLSSNRYLARSIIPHILRLSSLFNREKKEQDSSLNPYWKESSNPAHLRLAYFLYFMPSNLFRVSSIWAELARLGFKWPHSQLRAIEFGAGPASGLCGIAAGSHYGGTLLPEQGEWALIEQDKQILELGTQWAETYLKYLGKTTWNIRKFHRKLDIQKGFLPKAAPQFNLWLMSFYLNEVQSSPQDLAHALIQDWDRHLEEEGVIILVEPALKLQSRKLLELRKELLAAKEKQKIEWLQILLPCLGHQNCGALSQPEDWCHEEVTWWRPPYFRLIDKMASLDRKTLPFSYLVITKSTKKREEILPMLAQAPEHRRYRLVSPAHHEGRDLEFFVCGQEGKRRTRYRPESSEESNEQIQRGDILGADIRGDRNASRMEKVKKV